MLDRVDKVFIQRWHHTAFASSQSKVWELARSVRYGRPSWLSLRIFSSASVQTAQFSCWRGIVRSTVLHTVLQQDNSRVSKWRQCRFSCWSWGYVCGINPYRDMALNFTQMHTDILSTLFSSTYNLLENVTQNFVCKIQVSFKDGDFPGEISGSYRKKCWIHPEYKNKIIKNSKGPFFSLLDEKKKKDQTLICLHACLRLFCVFINIFRIN